MRHKYLYYSPRGFSNEWTVFKIKPDQMEEAKQWADDMANDVNKDCRFITRREADRLCALTRSKRLPGESTIYGSAEPEPWGDWEE